jgi:hypothetical protein
MSFLTFPRQILGPSSYNSIILYIQLQFSRWGWQEAFPFGHLIQSYCAQRFRVCCSSPELAVWHHTQLDQLAVVTQSGFLPLEGLNRLFIDTAPV